jgi:hypothetical protein
MRDRVLLVGGPAGVEEDSIVLGGRHPGKGRHEKEQNCRCGYRPHARREYGRVTIHVVLEFVSLERL